MLGLHDSQVKLAGWPPWCVCGAFARGRLFPSVPPSSSSLCLPAQAAVQNGPQRPLLKTIALRGENQGADAGDAHGSGHAKEPGSREWHFRLLGPISAKNHPELKTVMCTHARCIFSRISIGKLPFEGQLPRPKQKQGQKSRAAESHPWKSHGHWPKAKRSQ